MAEQVDVDAPDEEFWGTARGGPSLVDWDRVFDGQVWRLEKGTDFRGKAKNFSHSVYRQAGRRGLKARVKVQSEEVVFVQAVGPKEEPVARREMEPVGGEVFAEGISVGTAVEQQPTLFEAESTEEPVGDGIPVVHAGTGNPFG